MDLYFKNADQAFIYLYENISNNGYDYNGTMALFNVGFTIKNPLDNLIRTSWRNWNIKYADFEWQWYLSGDRSGIEISKKAKIWKKCMDENGEVNSNYGWHWKQNDQIGYVIEELRKNPYTRRAAISIYDAKNRWNFENDTPCTYAIHFYILEDKLNMNVMMRSNDLWFGFCNDQYFFSKLLKMISNELNIQPGQYYHFANNIHLYNNFINKKQ